MTNNIVASLRKSQKHHAVQGSFYAEQILAATQLSIEVGDLGVLSLPLTQDDVKCLLALSSKAKFGLRSETLLDEAVRDTREIGAKQMRVEIEAQTMAAMLQQMRRQLGLPENAVLTAHLHNLLVYGSGQFFKQHQDSEKVHGMVASMVVVLPSPHIGGDLIITHGKEEHRFSSENLNETALKCIAFYADCRHEVATVKQGYRVALTYNIALAGAKSDAAEDHVQRNPALEAALDNYFSTTILSEREDRQKTLELAYFFDHSYTEHSLRWDLLKGADASNARAFRLAAHHLGLVPHLALVEVHESWAYNDEDKYGEPIPDELIDGGSSLTYWVDADSRVVPYGEHYIADHQICWTTATQKADLVNSESEGWMGNYGNTVDFWYRRAALVLWRAEDDIAMRFQLNHQLAMNDLLTLTQTPGNQQKVMDTISLARKYLFGASTPPAETLRQLTPLVVYTDNAEIAQTLLQGLHLSDLSPACVQALVQLQTSFGAAWCMGMLHAWNIPLGAKGREHLFKPYNPNEKIGDIQALSHDWLSAGGDAALVAFVVQYYADQIVKNDAAQISNSPLDRQTKLPKRLLELTHFLRACELLGGHTARAPVIAHVIANQALYPLAEVADLCMQLNVAQAEALGEYRLLHAHVLQGLQLELAQGLRANDDWTIEAQPSCSCTYCNEAQRFLNSRNEAEKIWPIAATHRQHVMWSLTRLALPISFDEIKKGSPHKLVITKSPKLHALAGKRFETIRELYARMQDNAFR
jgi:hypothetical protein